MAWVAPSMITPIEYGPRWLSVNVTEKVKVVAVVPEPGLTPPLESVEVWPLVVQVAAAATGGTKGALKPSTIVTTSDGTSMPSSGRTAG
jgi:hypothetical protein